MLVAATRRQQAFERRARRLVGRRDLQHRAIARDRGVGVGELVLDDARRTIREVGAVARADRKQGAAIDDIEQLGPHSLGAVDPIELGERGRIALIVVEHGGELADRLIDVLEIVLVDLRRGEPQRLACRQIGGQLDLALEGRGELARIVASPGAP